MEYLDESGRIRFVAHFNKHETLGPAHEKTWKSSVIITSNFSEKLFQERKIASCFELFEHLILLFR